MPQNIRTIRELQAATEKQRHADMKEIRRELGQIREILRVQSDLPAPTPAAPPSATTRATALERARVFLQTMFGR